MHNFRCMIKPASGLRFHIFLGQDDLNQCCKFAGPFGPVLVRWSGPGTDQTSKNFAVFTTLLFTTNSSEHSCHSRKIGMVV